MNNNLDKFNFLGVRSPMTLLIISLLISLGYRVVQDRIDTLTFHSLSGEVRTVNLEEFQNTLDNQNSNLDEFLSIIGLEFGEDLLDFDNFNYLIVYQVVDENIENSYTPTVMISIKRNVNDQLEFTYYIIDITDEYVSNSTENKVSLGISFLYSTDRRRFMRTLHNLAQNYEVKISVEAQPFSQIIRLEP